MNNVPNIKMEEVSNTRTSYLDITTEINLGEDAPKLRKMPCIPIDLRCFLPASWDAVSEDTKKDYIDRLSIIDPSTFDDTTHDERIEFQQNNYIIGGEENIPIYDEAITPLRRVLSELVPRPRNPNKLTDNDNLNLYPLKLLYFTIALDSEKAAAVDRDIIDLIFDKIALAALLPYIVSTICWPNEEQSVSLETNADISQALDLHILEALRKRDILSFPLSPTITTATGIEVKIPHEYWTDLFKYAACPDSSPYYVTMPINDLDEILKDHLSSLFKSSLLPAVQGKKIWDKMVEQLRDKGSYRRTDYGYFYSIIDEFFKDRKRPLSYGKIPFLGEDSTLPLPHIDFIDLRPQLWEGEAMRLSTEMRIASGRYKKAIKKFESIPHDELEILNAVSEEIKKSAVKLANVKAEFSKLSSEVEREGFELKVMALPSDDLYGIDNIYRLTKKHIVNYTVKLKKQQQRIRRRIDMVPIRRCRRVRVKFGPFTIRSRTRCFTEMIPHTRSESYTHTWYETVKKIKHIDTVEPVSYRQVDEYLERNVTLDSFTSPDQAKSLANDLNIPLDITDGVKELNGLLNRHKRVHIFNLISGDYIDQNGRTLDIILDELDQKPIEDINRILLLIPNMNTLANGESIIEGYNAVHLPSLGRGSLIQPRIYLQETYALKLGRQPGHWLGKLSHCESLFPGEKRTFKLAVERTEESMQSSENSLNAKRSTSLKIELEDRVTNSFEKQKEDKQSKKWNAKTSGGVDFGVWNAGGSAGASGSSSQSTKEITKKINQNIEKTVSQHSQDKEVNFKANFSKKTEISSIQEETRAFENINEGRSVNYKFFQIMHKYAMETSLREMKIVVEYSDELIPGLDIQQTEVFNPGNLDLLLPEIIEEQREAIKTKLLEFINNRHEGRKINFSDGTSEDINFLIMDENRNYLGIDQDNVVDRNHWFTNSGSFFVETEVSSQPATEKYIEDARNKEIEVQEAKKLRIEAEAKAISTGAFYIPTETNSVTVNIVKEGLSQDGTEIVEG